MLSRIATLHFAPTNLARNNLLKENIDDRHILVTGNTVVDALLHVRASSRCQARLCTSFLVAV